MAADIINLRQARKAKARKDSDGRAAENRVRFGRTKAEKQREAAEESIKERLLDGHRRSAPSEDET
ncbi:DUF4169 family protein [Stappia sp. F7233]|uniref:DUF4169 family protein n=1 Tax=Stappia albiluteola TaxID=2758565 RepID=A0A839AGW5_9HYPH|nr:DUF4169 family protein [Stappia albiluteola]MBA5777779.1 DUF4169 family protein [Stappia albiluteola]